MKSDRNKNTIPMKIFESQRTVVTALEFDSEIIVNKLLTED